jgi:pyridoxamine 5'-phosphate oxidase
MYWLARVVGLRGVLRGLHEEDLDPEPMAQFQRWYATARRLRLPLPNAMTLATATPDGHPSTRFVLLKQADQDGVVFYTNYLSRKARELDRNPRAALVLYWPGLERQVRFEGTVERTSPAQSDAYFASRARSSQLGAWASRQSEHAPGRDALTQAMAQAAETYAGRPVPRPPHWGGYRLKPDIVEFWQGRAARLHDRFAYEHVDGQWRLTRLFP